MTKNMVNYVDEMIEILKQIKDTELAQMENDEVPENTIIGVSFGMNFMIDRVADYFLNKDSLEIYLKD